MSAKRMRKLLTVVLSTSMVLGCTITAFADTSVEGQGDYEGGAVQFPIISCTLPTIDENAYDYIADPNGLIAATSAAHYGGATFTGSTGVFFKTTDAQGDTKATYTEKSKAFTVTSQNARDLDVTVKLEQKTAGSDIIEYADSATFENTDKANKLYLAVTDGAQSNAKTAALSSSAAATLTTTVPGVPGNYEQKWVENEGYKYALKTEGLADWGTCSYNLTGALNKNATWEDGVTFPVIKVTWSFAEHSDTPALSLSNGTANTSDAGIDFDVTFAKGTAKTFTFTGLGEGVTLKSVTWGTSASEMTSTTSNIPLSGASFTINANMWGSAAANDVKYIKITASDDTVKVIKVTIS